jgi:hypothetical protein
LFFAFALAFGLDPAKAAGRGALLGVAAIALVVALIIHKG